MQQQLILIRGLPGSGKSTLAQAFVRLNFCWYEADQYMIDSAGNYCFDQKVIPHAHAWCQVNTAHALKAGFDVVVSNTFTRYWEIMPYLDLAQELNISPQIIVAKGQWKNIHGVPESVIKNMRNRWEQF